MTVEVEVGSHVDVRALSEGLDDLSAVESDELEEWIHGLDLELIELENAERKLGGLPSGPRSMRRKVKGERKILEWKNKLLKAQIRLVRERSARHYLGPEDDGGAP